MHSLNIIRLPSAHHSLHSLAKTTSNHHFIACCCSNGVFNSVSFKCRINRIHNIATHFPITTTATTPTHDTTTPSTHSIANNTTSPFIPTDTSSASLSRLPVSLITNPHRWNEGEVATLKQIVIANQSHGRQHCINLCAAKYPHRSREAVQSKLYDLASESVEFGAVWAKTAHRKRGVQRVWSCEELDLFRRLVDQYRPQGRNVILARAAELLPHRSRLAVNSLLSKFYLDPNYFDEQQQRPMKQVRWSEEEKDKLRAAWKQYGWMGVCRFAIKLQNEWKHRSAASIHRHLTQQLLKREPELLRYGPGRSNGNEDNVNINKQHSDSDSKQDESESADEEINDSTATSASTSASAPIRGVSRLIWHADEVAAMKAHFLNNYSHYHNIADATNDLRFNVLPHRSATAIAFKLKQLLKQKKVSAKSKGYDAEHFFDKYLIVFNDRYQDVPQQIIHQPFIRHLQAKLTQFEEITKQQRQNHQSKHSTTTHPSTHTDMTPIKQENQTLLNDNSLPIQSSDPSNTCNSQSSPPAANSTSISTSTSSNFQFQTHHLSLFHHVYKEYSQYLTVQGLTQLILYPVLQHHCPGIRLNQIQTTLQSIIQQNKQQQTTQQQNTAKQQATLQKANS